MLLLMLLLYIPKSTLNPPLSIVSTSTLLSHCLHANPDRMHIHISSTICAEQSEALADLSHICL